MQGNSKSAKVELNKVMCISVVDVGHDDDKDFGVTCKTISETVMYMYKQDKIT